MNNAISVIDFMACKKGSCWPYAAKLKLLVGKGVINSDDPKDFVDTAISEHGCLHGTAMDFLRSTIKMANDQLANLDIDSDTRTSLKKWVKSGNDYLEAHKPPTYQIPIRKRFAMSYWLNWLGIVLDGILFFILAVQAANQSIVKIAIASVALIIVLSAVFITVILLDKFKKLPIDTSIEIGAEGLAVSMSFNAVLLAFLFIGNIILLLVNH